MYLKTTNTQFLKYGKICDRSSDYEIEKISVEKNELQNLYSFNCDTQIEILEGIGIIITMNEDNTLEEFVIHRSPVIYAHVPYAIIPITNAILVGVSYNTKSPVEVDIIDVEVPQKFEPIQDSFSVTNVYSYYYNVKGKGYSFDGESHQFWELTYVDTGNLLVEVDGEAYTLKAQDMMIFFPGQFHKQKIEGDNSASYLTIMFDINLEWEKIEHLKDRVIQCNDAIYSLVNKFIQETIVFESQKISYSKDLIVLTLKEILINMVQIDEKNENTKKIINPIQSQFENELLKEIDNYLHSNIYAPLTVEDICTHFSISRSTLQSLFKKHVNIPPKRYINDLKMKQAQRLILEKKYSITEIALNLGFSSIHYFSRKFKSNFGLSPTEYLQSVYKMTSSDQNNE